MFFFDLRRFQICWCNNDTRGRVGNKDKHRDRKPHRPAVNERCLRSRCKVGCRAARDGPAAKVDQNLVYLGASSVIKTKRQRCGKVWQARRTCLRCVERLEAGHVAMHPPVGQEADERREESSGVRNFHHERGLDQWPREGQQLYAALPDRTGHAQGWKANSFNGRQGVCIRCEKDDKLEVIVLKDDERGSLALAAHICQQKIPIGAWIVNTMSADMDLLGDADLVLKRDRDPPPVQLPNAVRDTHGGKTVFPKLPAHNAQVHGAARGLQDVVN